MSHTHHGQDLRVESQIRLKPFGIMLAKRGSKLRLFRTAERFHLYLNVFLCFCSCCFCAAEQLRRAPLVGQDMGHLGGHRGGGRCPKSPSLQFGCQSPLPAAAPRPSGRQKHPGHPNHGGLQGATSLRPPYLGHGLVGGGSGHVGGEGSHLHRLLAGCQEDAAVGEGDGGRRKEESQTGGHQGVGQADQQPALVLVPLGGDVRGPDLELQLVPAHLDGQEGGQRSQGPGGQDEPEGSAGGHSQLVFEGGDDEQVAVQADDAEVEDGSAAAHDVEGVPEGAEVTPQHPAAVELVEHGWRHDHQPHHQVGHKEGHQEVVGGVAEGALGDDEEDEEEVPCRGQQDDEAEESGHPAAPHQQRALAQHTGVGGPQIALHEEPGGRGWLWSWGDLLWL